jgi:hypothetical protein
MRHHKIVVLMMISMIGLVGFWGVLQLQLTARAQSEPEMVTDDHAALLPLVMGSIHDIPTPTPTPTLQWATQTKAKSGIHLGNRGSDWTPPF